MSELLVDVIMITYNHEKYVSEAIDGILMQQTNFCFRLIIGEDFSSDRTRSICEEFVNKYPDKIILLQSDKNWGGISNFIRVYNECQAPYIAICEGDDYWTDKLKLQKQIDFLISNPDYSITAHSTFKIENGSKKSESLYKSCTYTLTDFIKSTRIGSATCSIVLRNSITLSTDIQSLAFRNSAGGDWLICISALKTGKMKVFNDAMAVYRLHQNSAFSSKSWLVKFQIHTSTALAVDKLTGNIYHDIIINFNVRKLFLAYREDRNLMNFDTFLEEYEKLDTKKWRRKITTVFLHLPIKKFYLKYLSKLFFYKMNIR